MYIREHYLKKIRPFYNSDLIKVLIGVRRSGKSVILRQIISELKGNNVDNCNIIYVNFEDLDYSFIKNEMDLHNFIKERVSGNYKYYFLFDEIQNVENFEKAINSFKATIDCSIFITGSNGKLLSGELATHLSGRYVSFRIMPFSFSEMCRIKSISKDSVQHDDFIEYLNYGGMPQRFMMQSEEMTKVYLRDLYNSIVLRDIIQRSNMKDINILNKIIEYLVLNTSQIFSAKSISKFFKSANRSISLETIYNYLEYITSSLILNKAVRYDIQGKKILTRSDKYYLTDPGFAKINNTGYKTDIGAMIQNIIFNELIHRGYDVYVGKTSKGEVDFIVMNGEYRIYYQVAYLLADEKVIKREFGAYESIKDNYPKYVLSMDKVDFSRNGVIHKNIIDFLLENL
ncbi:MAG: ATP-binding protein [Candidatus Muirbacterium halophilum]|nr:ATP-binding protein [Candidatus Muirbacterium halophilum]MCK9476192.1 ATP-binding protein [Candidatus Muirbacterium halophilum]